VGAIERGADRFDGAQIGRGCASEVAGERQVVLERQVYDAIRSRSGRLEPMEVIEVAAPNDGPGGRQRGGGRVGAGEADDLVPGGEEFGDNCGTDVAGGAGDKYAHGESS
jgi:hypothetical protein